MAESVPVTAWSSWLHMHILPLSHGVMLPYRFSLATCVVITAMSQQDLSHQVSAIHIIKICNKTYFIIVGKHVNID